MTFSFMSETLIPSLLLTLKGMLGIFAMILVIWGFVALLNRLSAGRSK